MSDLTGHRVLITGAGGTIGRAAATELAARGARTLLVGRDEGKLTATRGGLAGDGHEMLALDVGDGAAWEAADAALDEVTDVVCAAAVLTPVGEIGDYSPAEFWQTMQINVLGSLLAVHHTIASVRAARGTIVFFSGGGATKPLPRYDAYAASKAAVVRLAENLATTLASDGVRVHAIAPGFVASEMHDVTLQAGPNAAGDAYYADTRANLERGGVPPERSAALVAALLGGAGGDVTGRLLSAEWDPWHEPRFFEQLRDNPDLGTLRRIDDMFFVTKASS